MTEDSLAITVSARQWIGLCALAGGYFIALLDLTIINLAVPSLTRDLSASTAQVFWAVNSYGLVLALAIIPSGRLGDRFRAPTALPSGDDRPGGCQPRLRCCDLSVRFDRQPVPSGAWCRHAGTADSHAHRRYLP